MKKLLLLVLFFSISISLFSQDKVMLLDSIYSYFWDIKGTNLDEWWERTIYSYDISGNQTEEIISRSNRDAIYWIEFERYSSVYDPEGRIVERIEQNEAAMWKHVYSYDDQDNIIEEIRYHWDESSDDWIIFPLMCFPSCWEIALGGRILYSYNSNSNVKTPSDPEFYLYSYGNSDTITYFDWDTINNDWLYSWQRVFLFDTNGFITEGFEYRWDTVSGEWNQAGIKMLYENDESGNIIQSTQYACGYPYDSCRETSIRTWDYDSNGLLIECNEEYRTSGNTWIPEDSVKFYYMSDGKLQVRISNRYVDWGIDHNKIFYYWSDYNTSIESSSEDPEYIIYPNPTNDLLTIETYNPNCYSIAITSLNGQLLYSDKIEGPTHQIDLSTFQKGIYFITIRSKNFVRTKKIIKL